MIKLIYLSLLVVCGWTFAVDSSKDVNGSDYKNLFEISAGGFGWSSSSGEMEANVGGTNLNADVSSSELVINYARKLGAQFWLQGALKVETSETDFEDNTLGSDSDETDTTLAITGIYDFNENPLDSFFVKFGIEVLSLEDINGTTRLETEFTSWAIGVGKRWSLAGMGLPNASYSLGLGYFSGSGEIQRTTTTVDLDIDGIVLSLMELHLFF